MDNLSGTTIKGYELRERIGVGGFGAVYRAYQPVIDREVAVKVILPEHANQPEFIRNFESEAQLVARLEHPHIVPLFDYWREPDGAFLVMRYVRRGSLRTVLDGQQFELETVATILDQITAALAVAHRAGVVHRDLKPDNILMDDDDNAYLTDFGISRVVGHESTTDSVSGSLRYISPEQLKSQPPAPPGDIYSLGVMLFEMLTGQYPFAEASPSQLILKHLNDPLPDVRELRPDLPAAISAVVQKATAKDVGQRYTDARQIAADFRQALRPTEQVTVATEWDESDVVNPYKGLRAFREADAEDFFGREALINQLLARISDQDEHNRFLAVVGPSGSGKSSVVRAGLAPRIREGAIPGSADWFIVDMLPGAHPLQQLETALLRVALRPPARLGEMLQADEEGLLFAVDRVLAGTEGDLLLIIDQFEEVFTMVDNERERAQFLELLRVAVTAPGTRLRVIITLRADFTDRPLQYVEFGHLIRRRTEFVLPLSADEIERAITGPAGRVGLQVDTDLIAAVVADVREEPGALPLLQYVLTEVFERRDGRRLTLAAYQDSGGVMGALGRRAEEVYVSLEPAQQAIARQVFLRMVTLGEGTEDTRRRARRSELASLITDESAVQAVLDRFGQHRLLTFDVDSGTREPMIEVAHEALIREWERLRDWLDDSRADVRLERLLAGAVNEWEKAERDPGFLLSGTRLAQYEEWAGTTSLALTEGERDFLKASVAERQRQEAAEQERKAREEEIARRADQFAQRSQQFRRAAAVLAVVGLLAIGATIFAIIRATDAFTQAEEAEAFVATAQTQVAVVGQTLTPAEMTVQAGLDQIATATIAQGEALGQASTALAQVEGANIEAADAQTQVALSNLTLTPVALTLDAGDALLATSQANVERANIEAAEAQTQVAAVGSTLTPVEATLAAADALVVTSQAEVDQANVLAFSAQTQVAFSNLTLTPVARTLAAGDALLATSQAEVDQANVLAFSAQTQVAFSNLTLTPVARTLTAGDALLATSQANVQRANIEAADAQTQVAAVGSTLTPVGATLAAADALVVTSQAEVDQANVLAFSAQTQVAFSNLTLTPVARTLAAGDALLATSQAEVQEANIEAAEAQTQVAAVGSTLTPVGATLAAADALVVTSQAEVDQANVLAFSAQTQVAFSNLTLTPVARTLAAGDALLATSQAEVQEANIEAAEAQTQVAAVGSTLTPVGATLAAADALVVTSQAEVDQANVLAFSAQTQVAFSNLTLTPVARTLAAGDALLATSQAEVQEANIEAAEAQTQVAAVGSTLTPVGATLAAADALVAGAETEVAFAQAEVATAAVALTPVQATLIAAEATAAYNADQALSQSLAVNADQAASNGDYDLALALALESSRINPDLTQTQRLINQITYSAARFSFIDTELAALSPDSQRLAIAEDGVLTLWEIATREELYRLEGHTDRINAMKFTSDGRYLVSAGADGALMLWDTGPGESANRLVRRFEGHSGPVNDLDFNPDETLVYSVADDNQIIAWNLGSGEEFRRYSPGNQRPLVRIYVYGNGQQFLVWSAAGPDVAMSLWDTQGIAPRWTNFDLVYGEFDIRSGIYAFNQADGDNALVIWGTNNHQIARRVDRGFNWNDEIVTSKTFSPAATEVLVSVYNRQTESSRLLLLDFVSQEGRAFQGSGTEQVNALAFSPDGTVALSGYGSSLVMWDVAQGQEIRRLAAHSDDVAEITFSADGNYALTRSIDGNYRVWDVSRGDPAELRRVRVQTQIATASFPGLSPDGGEVYAGVWVDMFAWNTSTSQQSNRVLVGDEIINMVYSPTDPFALAITRNSAALWNVSEPPERAFIRYFGGENENYSGAAAFSRDGEFIVLDGQTLALRNRFNQRLQTFDKSSLPSGYIITDLAISPDNRLVLASTGNPNQSNAPAGDVIVWDAESGEEVLRLDGSLHNRKINSVDVSPDGQYALTASDDNTLILWELETGRLLRRFAGHRGPVNVAVFSPDRRAALSASDDLSLILWDLASGQPIRRYTGHSQPITGLALSSDGRTFASTTGDDKIILWRVETLQDVVDWTYANRHVHELTCAEANQFGVQVAGCEQIIAIADDASTSDVPPGDLPAEASPSLTPSPTFTPEISQPQEAEALVEGVDCSSFALLSPLDALGEETTTFTWGTIAQSGDYWVRILNAAGQQVTINNAGDAGSITLDTSPGHIGPGPDFSWEVTVFYQGQMACTPLAAAVTRGQ
jgi:WD40 repeat protein